MSTRLPGSKYKRVFDRGRVFRAHLFIAYVLRGEDAGRQAGVVVSKRSFHDAVDRNRAKRILREAFRLSSPQLAPDADWVLVGRASLKERRTGEVSEELMRLARRNSLTCGPC